MRPLRKLDPLQVKGPGWQEPLCDVDLEDSEINSFTGVLLGLFAGLAGWGLLAVAWYVIAL